MASGKASARGEKNGPAGHAFATALSSQREGHSTLLAVVAPNLPCKPDTILFNTDKRRAKYRNLERDPRVSLSIHNTDKTVQPYEWIQVRGRVQGFEDDPELAQLDELSRKYTGGDYRNREPGQQRVVVRVTPERITYAPGR